MTFYDRFVLLSNERHLTPSRCALECGISKSLLSRWKSDPTIVPTTSVLQKIADYFDVTINYLCGNENENDHLSPEEIQMLSLFRLANEDDRLIISLVLKRYGEVKV